MNKIQKIYFFRQLISFKQLGYSINEIVIVIAIVGVLASILIPNFRPAVEFIEVLIAEKHLLKAVKECQIGIINNELSPQYTLPKDEIKLVKCKKCSLVQLSKNFNPNYSCICRYCIFNKFYR